MTSSKQSVKDFLLVIFFLIAAVITLGTKKASAAVQLSTTFPDPNATSISTNSPSSPSPLYLTVGEGEFSAHTSGATILSDSPGTFRLRIDHADWCNDNLDLPTEFGQAYRKTYFGVWSVSGTSGNYKLVSEKTKTITGYNEECNSSKNDRILSFNLTSSDYNATIKKYVAIAYGSQAFQAPNPAYGRSVPAASENSFRFIISGPGNPGMTFAPPNTLGSFYNFSNRNRSTASQLSSSIILNTPCSLATQNVTIQFIDADNGIYQSTGSGNYNFPLNFSVKRSTARSTLPTINVLSPTKITGGDKDRSQKFTIPLERSYTYEFKVSGLSTPNALTFELSTDVDPLFASTECNTPPSGSINVSCSATTGLVTISSASITDKEGGQMSISATKPDGTSSTGSASISANLATNINFSSSNTFNGIRDGVNRTISGKVTDPDGLSGDISGTYKCDPPALSISCTISDITIELGDSASPSMTISRADTGGSGLIVVPSIVLNSKTYTNPAVTLNSSSSSTQTFQSVTLTEEKTYDVNGTIKRQSDNTTLATCASKINVVRKPFFKVTNGDLMVGGVYSSGVSCPATPTNAGFGSIASWAAGNPTFEATSRRGASADMVAQIFGKALEFYSANSITSMPSSMTKKWLTIANSTGDWGGDFKSANCMKDIYTNTIKSGRTLDDKLDLSSRDYSSVNKQEVSTSNLILEGTNNFVGKLAVYVTGNVYITSNIVMKSNYGSVAGIPFFALIVKGNIYIDPSVTQLDGMYVAQPNGNTGGTIFTCSSGAFTSYTSANIATSPSTYFTRCNKQLTFNGIVQAKNVKLHRTNGTLKTNTHAENFNNLPELYLTTTPFKEQTNTVQFDSATTLPPLL